MKSTNIEVSFKERKVHSFLEDLIELCFKHRISVYTDSGETAIEFQDWDYFTELDVDSEGASLYWPRIQTDIIVRRSK